MKDDAVKGDAWNGPGASHGDSMGNGPDAANGGKCKDPMCLPATGMKCIWHS